jgi:hypothetical protein
MPPDVLQHTITTSRLQTTAGIRNEYTTNLTDYPCLIQPITAEFAAKTGMVFDSSYFCITQYPTDMQIGDKVVDQDGQSYQVTGSLNRNYGFNVPHVTFLLTEEMKKAPVT